MGNFISHSYGKVNNYCVQRNLHLTAKSRKGGLFENERVKSSQKPRFVQKSMDQI